MLRRKLLIILGALVLLLLGVSVTAVILLQGVLGDLKHLREQATATVDDVSHLSGQIGVIQIELYRLQLKEQRHLDILLDAAEQMQMQVDRVGEHYVIEEDETKEAFNDLKKRLPVFYRNVGLLATAQDDSLARQYNQMALTDAVEINRDILRMSQFVRAHADREQQDLVSRFRSLALGLSVAFLILINGSIIILLRAAEMILRPVEKLVAASRALAQEKFDHRVSMDRRDEFGELAAAYNSLAEQLQANEQRKLEMIGQVALTLNHELNNAMAIIELQLELMKRNARGEQNQEKYLRQIRESLERMSDTVESLKRVRRIVLTEYVEGMKMLDLKKSVEE